MDNNGQQWTTMDNNGQKWTKMDNTGQKWTKMDNTGQQWTTIRSATCISDAVLFVLPFPYFLIYHEQKEYILQTNIHLHLQLMRSVSI